MIQVHRSFLVFILSMASTSTTLVDAFSPSLSTIQTFHHHHNSGDDVEKNAKQRALYHHSHLLATNRNPDISSTNHESITNSQDSVPLESSSSSSSSRRYWLSTIVTSSSSLLFLQPSVSFAIDKDTIFDEELKVGGPIVYGPSDIMNPKEHGTTHIPVQNPLRFGASPKLADKICCYNRYFAELGGYYKETDFVDTLLNSKEDSPLVFHDSVTGKPLFQAPIGRTKEEFLAESSKHGWPSFRDNEVIWTNVRVLENNNEMVSVDGTHLGHNLPDKLGNRYCINLVSIAGFPM